MYRQKLPPRSEHSCSCCNLYSGKISGEKQDFCFRNSVKISSSQGQWRVLAEPTHTVTPMLRLGVSVQGYGVCLRARLELGLCMVLCEKEQMK